MLYEYSFNELPSEEIEELINKSKEVRRAVTNSNYLIVTTGGIIIMMILFILNNYNWSNYNIIVIVCYIISMLMTKFRKEVDLKPFCKKVEESIRNKQSIEIDDGIYKHNDGKFTIHLNKNTVSEIITSKHHTIIMVIPKRLKTFFIVPIVIKNNIFESEDKYNEFIEHIKK